ncbi:hypothetical protein ACHHV8_17665 [Paenibacillus sp. TAB 01]|uniref:hypothetical protein n=1 Tax=Paenibacillus sp. TAB 01 TaxID=3368988 RepID=UPI003750400B
MYRKAGEADRRSFLVFITEKGKDLIDVTLPIEKQLIQDIKQCMSAEEYELFMKLLARINTRVGELTDRE